MARKRNAPEADDVAMHVSALRDAMERSAAKRQKQAVADVTSDLDDARTTIEELEFTLEEVKQQNRTRVVDLNDAKAEMGRWVRDWNALSKQHNAMVDALYELLGEKAPPAPDERVLSGDEEEEEHPGAAALASLQHKK